MPAMISTTLERELAQLKKATKKKEKYIILSRGAVADLEDDVNRYIAEGYIPQGGIAIRSMCMQAMVHKDVFMPTEETDGV